MNPNGLTIQTSVTGKDCTVTASGTAERRVSCEDCGKDYLYVLERSCTVIESSGLTLSAAEAERQAKEKSIQLATASLEKEIDPVPCPRCGHYQKNMVEICRDKYCFWMNIVAILAIVGFFISLIGVSVTQFGTMPNDSPWLRTAWLASLIVCVCAAPGLFFLRLFLAKRYDPNDGDLRERIRLGEAKAFLPESSGESQAAEQREEIREKNVAQAKSALAADLRFARLRLLIIPFVIACIGWWIVLTSWNDLWHGHASLSWPTTAVQLGPMHVEIEITKGRRGRESTKFVPKVSYSYTVDGQQYQGNRLQYLYTGWSDRQKVEAMLDDLRKTPNPTVSYDPALSSRSVLLPGLPEWQRNVTYVTGAVGLLATLVFLSMAVRFFLVRSEPNPQHVEA